MLHFPQVHDCVAWIERMGNCPLGRTHNRRRKQDQDIGIPSLDYLEIQMEREEKAVEDVVTQAERVLRGMGERPDAPPEPYIPPPVGAPGRKDPNEVPVPREPATAPALAEAAIWSEITAGAMAFAVAGAATLDLALQGSERALVRYRSLPQSSARTKGRGPIRLNFTQWLKIQLGTATNRRLRRREDEDGTGSQWVDPLFGDPGDIEGGEGMDFGEWWYLAFTGTTAAWTLGPSDVDPNDPLWGETWGEYWSMQEGDIEDGRGLPGPPGDQSGLPGDDEAFDS